ncbi:MAG TPA: type I methionyl aminopeptidase [Candidatus Babeliaceae bacterium]|nr:type I methionyl aminopeptidase [Candidatus Babeliaceae bacterium]
MITIKDKQALGHMYTAGQYLATILLDIEQLIIADTSTLFLDKWIEKQLNDKGLVSQSKGYHGYRHVSCISINDVVVHGIPSAQQILKEGDLVKIDVCAAWKGYCADMARCFFVQPILPKVRTLVDVAQSALDHGLSQVEVGNRLTDISAAIQAEVESHGLGVVRDFAGHGIGQRMHEEPEILNYGRSGKGPLLKVGMAFAIEPMITEGDYAVYVAEDGWTVKTSDGSLAAHVEDTVIITDQGRRIITRLDCESL